MQLLDSPIYSFISPMTKLCHGRFNLHLPNWYVNGFVGFYVNWKLVGGHSIWNVLGLYILQVYSCRPSSHIGEINCFMVFPQNMLLRKPPQHLTFLKYGSTPRAALILQIRAIPLVLSTICCQVCPGSWRGINRDDSHLINYLVQYVQ
jgi:hypothetical protein